MKRITMLLIVCCVWLLVAASACFAQMYTVTDLGASSSPTGLNLVGQVVGTLNEHAFLWTNSTGFQDLGILPGGTFSHAAAINDFGVVAGTANGYGTVITYSAPNQECTDLTQPFIWTSSQGMKGLGTVEYGGISEWGLWCHVPFFVTDINNSGYVVGGTWFSSYSVAFLWPTSQGITVFGGSWPPTFANEINNSGQIVGQDGQMSWIGRAASWKDGIVTYLGNLSGGVDDSAANGVNDLGQIVGWSGTGPGPYYSDSVHAVLWRKSGGILDLGTLPGDSLSTAWKINFFGQVIGSSGNLYAFDTWPQFHIVGRPFIWSEPSGMRDLNTLISPDLGWVLNLASDINGWGQIVGKGTLNGEAHGFLLTPIYKGIATPPVNSDGTSVFSAKRGVIPIRFTLTQYDAPTCSLQPATIFVTRIAGGTLGAVDESTYSMQADTGSNFRIDPSACQYVYNLAASSLGVGTYQVDVNINGIAVGHALFALK